MHIGGTLGVHSNVIWINHSGHDFAPQESMARGRERVLCRPVAVKRHRGCPGALGQGARVWAGVSRWMASGQQQGDSAHTPVLLSRAAVLNRVGQKAFSRHVFPGPRPRDGGKASQLTPP